MNDPYSVLGVSESSSEEEIKSAYRKLVKKYHPDRYVDNPIADLAEEKMKQINEAYEQILADKKNPSSQNSYSSNDNFHSNSSHFADVRRLFMQGQIWEAEEILNGVPSEKRDAEWNFLKSVVLYKKGWLDDAFSHAQLAVNYDPTNHEYREFYQRLLWQRNGGGRASGFNRNNQGCSTCDLCTGLMCLNCCCDSFC